MRVLIVTTWYPSVANPVSGIFVRRDAELLATEHDVRVLHLASPELISDADAAADAASVVPITRVPMSTFDPRAIRRAWSAIAPMLERAEILHTHAFSTLLPFAGRRVEKPWVHSEHWSGIADPRTLSWRGRLVLSATGRLLRRPDVVTAVSSYLADRVGRFRRGRIMIVPSVVPAAPLVAPPHDPDHLRLVAVGGLVPGKDPLLAVETVRELVRRGQPTTLAWAGDGPLRMSLEAEGGDSVRLLGAQDARGVAAALDGADIFVLPTVGETLCLSALEAITHGRPVVIGDRGGQRDYIEDANGRLVHDRTAVAFADAVQDVWSRRRELTPERVAATIGTRFQPASIRAAYDAAFTAARQEKR